MKMLYTLLIGVQLAHVLFLYKLDLKWMRESIVHTKNLQLSSILYYTSPAKRLARTKRVCPYGRGLNSKFIVG